MNCQREDETRSETERNTANMAFAGGRSMENAALASNLTENVNIDGDDDCFNMRWIYEITLAKRKNLSFSIICN